MSDTLSDIEVLLRRPDHQNILKQLNDKFGLLTPEEAQKLMERILSFAPGDLVPTDFRRFHRANRLHLLQKLIERLGPQKSEQFRARLTGTGPSAADPKLQKGLRTVFPPGTENQREQFLRALQAPTPSKIPAVAPLSVALLFRNDPKETLSPDNKCADAAYYSQLGPDSTNGKNTMEIQGTVNGHRPGVVYDFRRTIEMRIWYGQDGKWMKPESGDYLSPGTDDDSNNSDEDLVPDNPPYHIYVIDSAGFRDIPPDSAKQKNATECVYMLNAVETAWVKDGSASWQQVASLEWHSVTWLEKVGGKWRRKDGMNEIEKGLIFGLDMDVPPTVFSSGIP